MKRSIIIAAMTLAVVVYFVGMAGAASVPRYNLPADIITEATYPVTPGENPDVAKQRAFVSAMRLAHAKWVEAAGKLPQVIARKLNIAELYVLIEALNQPKIVDESVKTINGDQYYWVKLSNTLNMANLDIVYANMAQAEGKFVPLIRAIHRALEADNYAIMDYRLQYIYSGSALDRANLKKKIEETENRFVSTEWEFSGFVAYINNDLERAGIDLNKAVNSDPTNTDAYYARGLYFAATNQDAQAIADYTVVIKADSSIFDVLYRRAKLYDRGGNLSAAIVDYSACINLRPDSISAYLARGADLDKINQDDSALSDYNKVLAFDPGNQAALKARAAILLQSRRYDLAIADFTKLITANPKDIHSILNRASCYKAKGDMTKALADYKMAISLGDKEPAKFMDIAKEAMANQQYDLAIEALTDYILFDVNNADAFIMLGKCDEAKNDLEKAIADYSLALQISPNDTATLMAQANDYYKLSDGKPAYRDLAVANCVNAIQLDPKLLAAYAMRGKIYQSTAKYSAAIADYSSCITLAPDDAFYYNQRGQCYAALGKDKNKPREDFSMAIKLDPGNPAYLYDLAQFFDRINRAKSDTVRAYQDFVRAAGTAPQWADQVAAAKLRITQLGGKN